MTSFGHRAPLLWLVLPFMAGLAAGKMGLTVATPWLLTAAACTAALAWIAIWRAPRFWAPTLALAVFLAGSASYALHRNRLAGWESLPPREARLALRIDRVFQQTHTWRTSGLATVLRANEALDELIGQRIYFSFTLGRGEKAPARSSIISALGVISILPRDPAAETFEAYLADAGVNFRFARGHILALERPPTAYHQFCERLAQRMNALLGAGLDRRPQLAAIFRAMILGQKHELSEEQNQLFMHSGTMHLFAINGLHIGVVALAMHALLTLLRCPRRLASVLVLAVLWLDVDATGASPSAVRAFLMVAMFEAAWALRRPGNALAALAASAVIMLLIDPLDFFRASFQMSYGVVTAILTFGLPLAERMQKRFRPFKDLPEVTWNWLQRIWAGTQRTLIDAFCIGLAATLVSTITGAAFFHVIAPAGLIANLVLVPLAMLVIAAGFTSLVFGFAGVALASRLFNHAAAVLIWLIDALIRLGTRVPCAYFSAHYRAGWIAPVALAALMATCLIGYATGWRRKRGSWWPPFAIVALTLVFGVKFG
ncbi:MAG: ComEC/Rec2 family competence protein [Verrucomicrobiota bacterium]|nr:ComEC/Rec2 family competence protein [Verrucomicrobiota bacterium]